MKLLIIMLFILLSACTNEEKVFSECKFELTKIIALKGEDLDKNDDWNRVMKRQFFSECFESKGYKFTEDLRQRVN